MGTRRRVGVWAALPLVACVAASGSVIRAAEWDWTVVPYLWASDVGFDLEVNDEPVLGGDVSFSDLVDKLEIGGMVHVEGRTGRSGFFADLAYVSVEDSGTTPANPPLLPDGAATETELTMGRYEAAGFYRFENGDGSGFDFFLGVRCIDFDQEVDITRTTPSPAALSASAGETLIDGFFGARFGMPFKARFWFNVRGDIGTGDTELSWTANAGLGMWLGETRKYGLELAYEHFEFEVEGLGGLVNVTSESRMSGPIFGFVFQF